MAHPTPVVMESAGDLFALFVIAIIVFNIISAIVQALRKAAAGAMKQAGGQAQQRVTPALQRRTVGAGQADAARAAELARLRKALLASAGLAEADVGEQAGGQVTTSAATDATAARLTRPTVRVIQRAATSPQTGPARSVANAGSALASRLVQPLPASPSLPDFAAPQTGASDWSLAVPGALMALESAATAFTQLSTPGAPMLGAPVGPSAKAQLAVLQMPNSGVNLFVAAAIVGPCAAFRRLGHTPGGW